MYKRGHTKEAEKSERIEENLKKITGGKKKWVRYDEGAMLYSMGIHSFQKLAKDAKATYHVNRIALVNTENLDEYIELLCADETDF